MRLPVTTEQFLAEYWQQKPLLCPQALPHFHSPITAEELAGLAMEPDIDSRMVWQDSGVWHQQTGPFAENAFRGEMPWTLLVQGVDRHHPGVSALRNTLPPLPRWRFDDVMVSFATDRAGVGPHFDRYDVFLLQGAGRREWRIGPHCDDETPQLQENGLNLIQPFEAAETYVLEPGDVLYVPPGIAHWGVALGQAITYSLGFRAPPSVISWRDGPMQRSSSSQPQAFLRMPPHFTSHRARAKAPLSISPMPATPSTMRSMRWTRDGGLGRSSLKPVKTLITPFYSPPLRAIKFACTLPQGSRGESGKTALMCLLMAATLRCR